MVESAKISRPPVSTMRVQQERTLTQRGSTADFSSSTMSSEPLTRSPVARGIFQLAQQWIARLGENPNQRPPQFLDISASQQDKLKRLMGFSPSAPLSISVIDTNRNGSLSVGDVAIVNGGITGGEIRRKTLNEQDVNYLRAHAELPQAFIEASEKWHKTDVGRGEISYTTQLSCRCPSEYTRAMNVIERNGRIIDAAYADTGEPVPVYVRDGLLTIEERFEQLQTAYENNADFIEANYDEELGYPSSVSIDQSAQIADEELNYTISNLQKHC
ncbi:DUF6174 domain-containing protein [Thiolinea disciformis]|uniref:DUF6174 domain-containing protein n=1 Tax=Thiolinea disciformis TaxID=125614 RepID=UPI0012FE9D1A|nr:DUF6174 domain-containing protein [Thiolinea disciformis]